MSTSLASIPVSPQNPIHLAVIQIQPAKGELVEILGYAVSFRDRDAPHPYHACGWALRMQECGSPDLTRTC
jgi:hypothetical protein